MAKYDIMNKNSKEFTKNIKWALIAKKRWFVFTYNKMSMRTLLRDHFSSIRLIESPKPRNTFVKAMEIQILLHIYAATAKW